MDDGVPPSVETAINPLPSSSMDSSYSESPPTLSTWFLIFLLIIFPPLAWYFLYKDKRYHRWFPILLYIYGALLLVSVGVMQTSIMQLIGLYNGMGVKVPFTVYTSVPIGIVFAAVMILFGLFLGMKIRAEKDNKGILITVILFFVSFGYAVAAIIYSIIYPIYGLISHIK